MSNAEEKVKSLLGLGCDKTKIPLTDMLISSIIKTMTEVEKREIINELESGIL